MPTRGPCCGFSSLVSFRRESLACGKPDLARTIVQLIQREAELGAFEVFHFRGHAFERGVEFAKATRAVAGIPRTPIRRFPWFAIYLLSPFVETFREMLEMRYLWQSSLVLDNRKLVKFLGEEPHTPLSEALAATLAGLGCAPRLAPPRGAAETFSGRAARVV